MTNLSDVDLTKYSYKDEHEQKYNYCVDEYAKNILKLIFYPFKYSSKARDIDNVNVFVLKNNTWRLNGAYTEYHNAFKSTGLKPTDKDLLDFNNKVTKALNSYSGKYVNYVLLPEYEITNSVFNDPVIHNGEFDVVIKFKVPKNKTTKKSTKNSVNE